MGRKMCLFRRKILREMQRVERGGKKRNISSFLSNIVTDDDYGVIGVSFFGGREWRGVSVEFYQIAPRVISISNRMWKCVCGCVMCAYLCLWHWFWLHSLLYLEFGD